MSTCLEPLPFQSTYPTPPPDGTALDNLEQEDQGKLDKEEQDKTIGQLIRDMRQSLHKWSLSLVIILSFFFLPVLDYGPSHMTAYTGDKWLLDSGIEYHITNNPDAFNTYRSFQTGNIDFLQRNLTPVRPHDEHEFLPSNLATTYADPADVFKLSHPYGPVLGYGTVGLLVCLEPAKCGSSCYKMPALNLTTTLYISSSPHNRISVG